MRKSVLFLLAAMLVSCGSNKSKISELKTPAEYVNVFVGTGGHGHTYPGATVPFGMVQLSPDTRTDSWDGCSGYHYSDSVILAFSHTHLSGTGVGDYGDLRFMPTTGKTFFDDGERTDEGYKSAFRHSTEEARPGFYSVVLDDYDVKVELTAGERFGMQRYTFPAQADAHVVVDLTKSIVYERIHGLQLNVLNDSTICGFRRSGSWADDQYFYFYAEFSKPFEGVSVRQGGVVSENRRAAAGTDICAAFHFDVSDGEPIVVRTGVSAVDVEGAKRNLLSECKSFDFDFYADRAFDMWNSELERFELSTPDEDKKTIFYTAYYHCLVSPNLFSDSDGRFRNHALEIDTASDRRYTVFSLWDTFRALHPLFNIVQRERSAEIINTFLNNYKTGGLLPVWELSANETNCMIGYHAVPVIVDAWQNGIRTFDPETALEAMVKSAESGLFGLDCYMNYGYIPSGCEGESVSKTLEYAYDDWCIARFAEMIGKQDVAEKFYERAQYYKNIFDTETKFMRGRDNGGFVSPFDPTQVNFMLTEANSWQYSFFVPQDVNTHIDMVGGSRAYERFIDRLFQSPSQLSGRAQADITGLIGQYAHGNEPSHHMAYLYNFVGKPIKGQHVLNKIMDEFYTSKPDGLIGNEDCGQMSAWYVFSSMGFYPVTPGAGYYVIGVPNFDKVTVRLENGKTFTVVAKNLSPENRYVSSVRLNGKKLNRSFLYYDEIAEGGELVFNMTSERNSTWATELDECPEMRITASQIIPVPTLSIPSKTFYDSIAIELSHPDTNAILFCKVFGDTIIGKKNFVVAESCDIEAWAEKDGVQSKHIQGVVKKIPAGRSISLKNQYSDQYPAGGQIALIDQLRGGNNFRTGTWQGFYGVDLEAVVDLGSEKEINRLAGSFLQEEGSWIFMPREVEFYASRDGKNYYMVGRVKNKIDPRTGGAVTQELGLTRKVWARYVKMIARSSGNCPDWHVGKGLPSWIFCDEFIIDTK